MKSRHDKSGRHVLDLRARREEALRLRMDGLSLRQISAIVHIDPANLCDYFKEYRVKEVEKLHEELFAQQTGRLYELWRAAAEDMRKFVPVTDSSGKPIMVPVLDEDGQPVLDEAGQPMIEYMRDFGVHLNAVNVAAKITERIAKHFGLDAPEKRLLMSDGGTDREITFRIVDASTPNEPVALDAPAAPDAPEAAQNSGQEA